jgi:hypothetical protein
MKLFADDTSLYCIVDDQNASMEPLRSPALMEFQVE